MAEQLSKGEIARKAASVAKAAGWTIFVVAVAWACISSAPAWYARYQDFRQEQRQAEALHGRVRVLDCIDAAKARLPKPIPRDTLAGLEANCAVADVNR